MLLSLVPTVGGHFLARNQIPAHTNFTTQAELIAYGRIVTTF